MVIISIIQLFTSLSETVWPILLFPSVDHRDDLQHGPVLCHQEQQGSHITVSRPRRASDRGPICLLLMKFQYTLLSHRPGRWVGEGGTFQHIQGGDQSQRHALDLHLLTSTPQSSSLDATLTLLSFNVPFTGCISDGGRRINTVSQSLTEEEDFCKYGHLILRTGC